MHALTTKRRKKYQKTEFSMIMERKRHRCFSINSLDDTKTNVNCSVSFDWTNRRFCGSLHQSVHCTLLGCRPIIIISMFHPLQNVSSFGSTKTTRPLTFLLQHGVLIIFVFGFSSTHCSNFLPILAPATFFLDL